MDLVRTFSPVRALRERRGWSQEHLAQVSGVARRTIQRIEIGAVRPSAETAMALAQHLETRPDEILMWASLRRHLRACIDAWCRRPPTDNELASLPPKLRRLFSAYYDDESFVEKLTKDFSHLAGEFEQIGNEFK